MSLTTTPPRRRSRHPAFAAGALAAAAISAAPAAAAVNQLDFGAPIPGTLAGTGFTAALPATDVDPSLLTVGGGAMVVTTTPGDAFQGFDDQVNALGLPVVDGPAGYRVTATVLTPPVPAQPYQSAGVFVGKGEGDYVKAVVSVREGDVVLNVVRESGGRAVLVQNTRVPLGAAAQITVSLEVGADGSVRPTYTLPGAPPRPPTATSCLGPCVDVVPAAPETRGGGVVAGIITTHADDPATPGTAGAFSPRFGAFVLDNANQTDPGLPRPVAGGSGGVAQLARRACTPGTDVTAPVLTGRSPAPGATVRRSAIVSVSFSEAVVVPRGAVRLVTGLGAEIASRTRLTPDSRTVQITPVEPLPAAGGVFVAVAGGNDSRAVLDAACNPLARADRSPVLVRRATGGTVRLTRGQLLVNQRVSQAAIARESAVRARLASLGGADVQDGSLGRRAFGPGVDIAGDEIAVLAPTTGGRPLTVPRLDRGDGRVALSVRQLRINQRISQAAVRRVNALQSTLDRGLTGGDLDDGGLAARELARGLTLTGVGAPGTPVPSGLLAPARPTGAGTSAITLTPRQLRINQAISQAAVRRLNVLRARLALGLTGEDFRAGSLGPRDVSLTG